MVKPIVLNPNENVGISEHWDSSHTKGESVVWQSWSKTACLPVIRK